MSAEEIDNYLAPLAAPKRSTLPSFAAASSR